MVTSRVLLALGAALLTGACAIGPLGVPPLDGAAADDVTAPAFVFAADSFAFPNEIRARHPDVPALYANYCFGLARGVRQFQQFARFDPALPKRDHAGYVALVRRIAARAPWEPALPSAERVPIPSYADLREFSRAEESAVKEGLGGRFWTMAHWTNWRGGLLLGRAPPDEAPRATVPGVPPGPLVPPLVTNPPPPPPMHPRLAPPPRPPRPPLAVTPS